MTSKDAVRAKYLHAAPVEEYLGWIIRDMATGETLSGPAVWTEAEDAWDEAEARMKMNSQENEQHILNAAVTEDEKLYVDSPLDIATLTLEQKQILAYEIWEADGAMQDDPRTLNHFLDAEVLLESGRPLSVPTE